MGSDTGGPLLDTFFRQSLKFGTFFNNSININILYIMYCSYIYTALRNIVTIFGWLAGWSWIPYIIIRKS